MKDTAAARIFVEKKSGFRVEADSLRRELSESLSINIKSLRLINVYDLEGFGCPGQEDSLLEKCRYGVFGEKVTDDVFDSLDLTGKKHLAVEYIPGQFDQRAASAVDCVHLIEPAADVRIRSSRLLVFNDDLTETELDAVRHYYINAVECRQKDLSVLDLSEKASVRPAAKLDGFISMSPGQYPAFCADWGLAMNADDLGEVVKYFKTEKRNPTETELRILDTYWSDHCRHTTFTTCLTDIEVDESFAAPEIRAGLEDFHRIRKELGREDKNLCLMELATIGARYLKSKGLLDDQEESGENNACSIFINVDVDGRDEKWLLQFKNETHNHPTEIEPFGGAATCLGGAIRDPLSGRAYVYQALRVTGAGDILLPVADTLPGKLPQKLISKKAAAGYSSYGNQIGLATTLVREIYDPGYVAKRLETGAVVGAVKASDVRREEPVPGDVVLLLGGRTGRDGIGGATGSSKEHTGESLENCGSEVQKGNAPEERKLQRLFRRPEATELIKKANDFGAGGVSVAIGELAPGLDIRLDRVPVKYAGLNSTELAISESQERMAVVVEKADREKFEKLCQEENVETSYVADVTSLGRMRMYNGNELVADLSREFIDSAGARHFAKARIGAVEKRNPFSTNTASSAAAGLGDRLEALMAGPNVASQKGLAEMFDSTIGRSTVLMPFGGRTQRSEVQVSVQKIPVAGFTQTASIMSFGYKPAISSWSPYHGAAYAIVEACSKLVAAGATWRGMRFSYQEYFERMTSDPLSWGKPLSALLGALRMQTELGLPSIGGKDSMSGSFETKDGERHRHINVPPTLIAFGINTVKATEVISTDFKKEGNFIYLVRHTPVSSLMPDTEQLKRNWDSIIDQCRAGNIVSGWAIDFGGVAAGLVKMAMGNALTFDVDVPEDVLFDCTPGSVIVESKVELDFPCALKLGRVSANADRCHNINGEKISADRLYEAYSGRYASIYPAKTARTDSGETGLTDFRAGVETKTKDPGYKGASTRKPLVFLPVFPGTNCDYDTAKAFRAAGADTRFDVFCNLSPDDVTASIDRMCRNLYECQILAICGGFSAGDEPDGSGKFIAGVLNNAKVADAVHALLERGGLILGICNGFQALVKSGLLPYGRLGMVTEESPTLFRNDINRHVSSIVSTRLETVASPWLNGMNVGDIHSIAVSHGEGKFTVSDKMAKQLFDNGQVAFRYVNPDSGMPTMESPFNPNGSSFAIEGIISPDGHILGKMGHSERWEDGLFRNISGTKKQTIFENAVNYFTK